MSHIPKTDFNFEDVPTWADYLVESQEAMLIVSSQGQHIDIGTN